MRRWRPNAKINNNEEQITKLKQQQQKNTNGSNVQSYIHTCVLYLQRSVHSSNVLQVISILPILSILPHISQSCHGVDRHSFVWSHFCQRRDPFLKRGLTWVPPISHYNLFSNHFTGLNNNNNVSAAPQWDDICGSFNTYSLGQHSKLVWVMFLIWS